MRACYHASSSCRAICPLTHTHAHHLAAIPPSVGWIWGALPVRIERTQSMRWKCCLGLKRFLDTLSSLWARGYFRWLLWSTTARTWKVVSTTHKLVNYQLNGRSLLTWSLILTNFNPPYSHWEGFCNFFGHVRLPSPLEGSPLRCVSFGPRL